MWADRQPAGRAAHARLHRGICAAPADSFTPARERPLGAYLRENVHYTFAGFNFPATFLDLLPEVGVGRIMFSADYPYGSMAEARSFLDHLPVSAADRERIAHRNAERLFKL